MPVWIDAKDGEITDFGQGHANREGGRRGVLGKCIYMKFGGRGKWWLLCIFFKSLR